MRIRTAFLPAAALLISACTYPAGDPVPVPDEELTCPVDRNGACLFDPGKVKLGKQVFEFPGRAYPFRKMTAEMDFVDGQQTHWVAPKGTLTDGASIPPAFVPIIGSPTAHQVASAAAIHDAYCGYGNEKGESYRTRPWRQVHRAFYDALISSGTPELKAKIMYAAVMLGGPRWSALDRSAKVSVQNGHMRPDLKGISRTTLISKMKALKTWIESGNPDVQDIDSEILRIDREFRAIQFRKANAEEKVSEYDPTGSDYYGYSYSQTYP